MTDNDLLIMCKEWQSRLRIQDWIIRPKFAHRYDIEGSYGLTIRHPSCRTADIKIAFPEECEPEYSDTEQTLVHELLHVVFWACDHGEGADCKLHEQAVDATASALVTLARARKRVIDMEPGKRELAYINSWRHMLQCRCCGMLIAKPELLRAIFALEDALELELRPTNMTRCARHNREVGGHPKSKHMTGQAIDVIDPDRREFEATARACGFRGVLHYPDRGIWHLQVTAVGAE